MGKINVLIHFGNMEFHMAQVRVELLDRVFDMFDTPLIRSSEHMLPS